MTDDLLRRIQNAQVEAAEDILVDDLRRKGLLPPEPMPKLAITIDLDQLQSLIREYLAQLPPRDRLETQLRFSHFMIWARKRRERLGGVMPVHMQTGQRIDVVFDWEGSRRVVKGIQRHGDELYQLTEAQARAVAEGLLRIL